jgi:hypothetical protein
MLIWPYLYIKHSVKPKKKRKGDAIGPALEKDSKSGKSASDAKNQESVSSQKSSAQKQNASKKDPSQREDTVDDEGANKDGFLFGQVCMYTYICMYHSMLFLFLLSVEKVSYG